MANRGVDVTAQFVGDLRITPEAGPDKVLQGAALLVCLGGNGFGGFALQASEFTAQDRVGVLAMLLAIEEGKVALQEGGEVSATGIHRTRGHIGLVDKCLGCGVFQDRGHANLPSECSEGYPSHNHTERLGLTRTVELNNPLPGYTAEVILDRMKPGRDLQLRAEMAKIKLSKQV